MELDCGALSRLGWKRRLPALALTTALGLTALGGTAGASHDLARHLSLGEPRAGATSTTFVGASDDGSRVFFSTADSLVSADTDTSFDIYERAGGTTRRVSAGQVNGNGSFGASFAGVSDDGSRVFFSTAEPLVSADTDSSQDLYERSGGTTTRVSAGKVNGNGAFAASFVGASDNGSRVFFETAEPLAVGDSDSSIDVFQRSGGATTRVSAGQINGNGAAEADFRDASDNGSRVFFRTAERLVAADTDSSQDLYERAGATTTLVSAGQINGNGAFDAFGPGCRSQDGSRLFFSTAERLVSADTDTRVDVYERSGGTTTLISAGQINGNGAFDADLLRGFRGRLDASSSATERATGRRRHRHRRDVYERAGATTTLISAGQIEATAPSTPSSAAALSADGSRVFFATRRAAGLRRHRHRSSTSTSAPAARRRWSRRRA